MESTADQTFSTKECEPIFECASEAPFDMERERGKKRERFAVSEIVTEKINEQLPIAHAISHEIVLPRLRAKKSGHLSQQSLLSRDDSLQQVVDFTTTTATAAPMFASKQLYQSENQTATESLPPTPAPQFNSATETIPPELQFDSTTETLPLAPRFDSAKYLHRDVSQQEEGSSSFEMTQMSPQHPQIPTKKKKKKAFNIASFTEDVDVPEAHGSCSVPLRDDPAISEASSTFECIKPSRRGFFAKIGGAQAPSPTAPTFATSVAPTPQISPPTSSLSSLSARFVSPPPPPPSLLAGFGVPSTSTMVPFFEPSGGRYSGGGGPTSQQQGAASGDTPPPEVLPEQGLRPCESAPITPTASLGGALQSKARQRQQQTRRCKIAQQRQPRSESGAKGLLKTEYKKVGLTRHYASIGS